MQPKRALLLSTVWPEPRSSAAGVREYNLVAALQELGFAVTVFSPCKDNGYRKALEEFATASSTKIKTEIWEANDSKIDARLRELKPDLVIFDRFIMEEQFGWRVREQCPQSLRILDTQDLHSLRRLREDALKRGLSIEQIAGCDFPLQGEDLLRELASIYRCDLTLVLSTFEQDLLHQRLGIPPHLTLHLPLFYRKEVLSLSHRAAEPSGDFVWIGNFRHPPNWDAVQWISREIWPKIRAKLPQATCRVFGAYPPREAMQLHNPKHGFEVLGPAPDVVACLSAHKINFAPLRYGAGIKGKILEGWRAGIACVTTEIGAEGLCPREAFGGLIANTVTDLVDAACRLDQDPALRQELAKKGRLAIQNYFDHESWVKIFHERVESALRDMSGQREENLIGQMLWHQTARSTEFFSRWIEAKNKRQDPS